MTFNEFLEEIEKIVKKTKTESENVIIDSLKAGIGSLVQDLKGMEQ